jgi:hypothetical protein
MYKNPEFKYISLKLSEREKRKVFTRQITKQVSSEFFKKLDYLNYLIGMLLKEKNKIGGVDSFGKTRESIVLLYNLFYSENIMDDFNKQKIELTLLSTDPDIHLDIFKSNSLNKTYVGSSRFIDALKKQLTGELQEEEELEQVPSTAITPTLGQ